MKKYLFYLLVAALFGLFANAGAVLAVEVAPRITDREIVERLSGLEEGQRSSQKQTEQRLTAMERRMDDRFTAMDDLIKAMEKRMDDRFTAMDDRIKAMEKRMDDRFAAMDDRIKAMEKRMDDRFAAMERRMDDRFAAMDDRFAAMERRMDDLWMLMLVLIAAIFGLIGFVVWDRKTALAPLEKRLAKVAGDLERELEPDSSEGSRLTRVIDVLRDLARWEPRLASQLIDALRRRSLSGEAPAPA